MTTTYSSEEVAQLQKTFEERQNELGPKEDLAPYAGKWVALHNGHVVASGASYYNVKRDSHVEDNDQIIPVPEATDGLFV